MPDLFSPYPLPAFHFKVSIVKFLGLTDTSFQEVSGIGSEIEFDPVTEGGENRFQHQLPKRVKHSNLVLKRGVALSNSPLVVWCKSYFESDFSTPFVPTQLLVSLLNEMGLPVAVWSFSNVYPVKWEIEGFNSTKSEVAIEKIELSYSYSKREV